MDSELTRFTDGMERLFWVLGDRREMKSWVQGQWPGAQTPQRMGQALVREGFAQATHIPCPGLPWTNGWLDG